MLSCYPVSSLSRRYNNLEMRGAPFLETLKILLRKNLLKADKIFTERALSVSVIKNMRTASVFQKRVRYALLLSNFTKTKTNAVVLGIKLNNPCCYLFAFSERTCRFRHMYKTFYTFFNFYKCPVRSNRTYLPCN